MTSVHFTLRRNVTKDAPPSISNTLKQILSRQYLDEAHIFAPGLDPDIVGLLERQTQLYALSIDHYAVNFTSMAKLERLSLGALVGEEILESVKEVAPQLTYLNARRWILRQLDEALFPKLVSVHLTIYSPMDWEGLANVSLTRRAARSLAAVSPYMSIWLEPNWTSQQLYNAVCGDSSAATIVTDLMIVIITSTPPILTWPSCTASWMVLKSVYLQSVPNVVLGSIPTTVRSLTIRDCPWPASTKLTDVLSRFSGNLEELYVITPPNNPLLLTPGALGTCSNCCRNLRLLSLVTSFRFTTGPNATFFFPEVAQRCPALQSLDIQGNQFSGTLPYNLFTTQAPLMYSLDVSLNSFTGTFPSFQGGQIRYASFSYNSFDTWPSFNESGPPSNIISVEFTYNNVTSLPNDASFALMPQLSQFKINANPFRAGPLPALWPSQAYINANPGLTLPLSRYEAANCAFNGSLPDLPSGITFNATYFYMVFPNNQLSGTIPASWSRVNITSIDLTNNWNITGSVPPLRPPPVSFQFLAANTSISGPMFDLTPMNGSAIRLDLSCTHVNVCDFSRQTLPKPTFKPSYCVIPLSSSQCASTLIPGSTCSTVDDSKCLNYLPPVAPQEAPEAAPADFPAPVEATTPEELTAPTPAPTTQVVPIGCPQPHPQPAERWSCVGNIWVSASLNSSTPTITVSSTTVVSGNMSVPQITFNGVTGVTIQVTGCAQVPKKVIVVLSEKEFEELKNGKKKFADLIESTECSFTNVAVPIQVSTATKKKKSCEKINASIISKGHTLQGVFELDKSACNRWWIALVATIGALVIIGVIVALVFILVPKARSCICPTSQMAASV